MSDGSSSKKRLLVNLEELILRLEKMGIAEYISLMEDPKKIIYRNFLAGVSRGIGTAIGFTLLGALIIYILQKLVLLNLPLIGDFIAEFIKIVQNNL